MRRSNNNVFWYLVIGDITGYDSNEYMIQLFY